MSSQAKTAPDTRVGEAVIVATGIRARDYSHEDRFCTGLLVRHDGQDYILSLSNKRKLKLHRLDPRFMWTFTRLADSQSGLEKARTFHDQLEECVTKLSQDDYDAHHQVVRAAIERFLSARPV